MELAFVVYLISILENIAGWFTGIAVISGFALFMLTLFSFMELGKIKHKKTFALLIFNILFFGSLRAMLPSEKQAYAIAAAYGAQQVYQSEEAKQIGSKVLRAINAKLDEMAEPEKGKK